MILRLNCWHTRSLAAVSARFYPLWLELLAAPAFVLLHHAVRIAVEAATLRVLAPPPPSEQVPHADFNMSAPGPLCFSTAQFAAPWRQPHALPCAALACSPWLAAVPQDVPLLTGATATVSVLSAGRGVLKQD